MIVFQAVANQLIQGHPLLGKQVDTPSKEDRDWLRPWVEKKQGGSSRVSKRLWKTQRTLTHMGLGKWGPKEKYTK